LTSFIKDITSIILVINTDVLVNQDSRIDAKAINQNYVSIKQ